ncbi:MAG: hypothetical protein OSA99_00570 [Acidimicrobiales bacterium]|nr:hypothetical protein [Acidimicrobiales bacterium]
MPRPLLTPGRLAIGMQLPIQSQSTNYAQPWELHAGPGGLEAIVRAADTNGFDYVAVCDHIAIPDAQAEAMSTTWYDTARVACGLGRLAALGATQLQVRFAARSADEYADQVARFGTEVAPLLPPP